LRHNQSQAIKQQAFTNTVKKSYQNAASIISDLSERAFQRGVLQPPAAFGQPVTQHASLRATNGPPLREAFAQTVPSRPQNEFRGCHREARCNALGSHANRLRPVRANFNRRRLSYNRARAE
jgi:hypothetical protein